MSRICGILSPGNAAGWSSTSGALQLFQGWTTACFEVCVESSTFQLQLWDSCIPRTWNPPRSMIRNRREELHPLRTPRFPGSPVSSSARIASLPKISHPFPRYRIPSQDIPPLPQISHPKGTTTLLAVAVTPTDTASPQALLSPGVSHSLSPTPDPAPPGSRTQIFHPFPLGGSHIPWISHLLLGYCISPL